MRRPTGTDRVDQGAELAAALPGRVIDRTDDRYPAVCAGFNQSVRQRPELVVLPSTVSDVVAAVRFASEHDLLVGVRATGHGPTAHVDDGLLIRTTALDGVVVDATRRRAHLQPGTTWQTVVEAAAPYGLVPLMGSAPTVGAISYVAGGGLGPFGRRYGYAADRVSELQMVSPDGRLISATAENNAELFWGARGAGANFGVIVGIDIELMPVSELSGGGIYFPASTAPEVMAAFLEATSEAPDELSLSLALLTFPPLGTLPEALRGKSCCHLRVTHLGPETEAHFHLRPFRRASSTLLNTVRSLPLTAVGSISGDPVAPRQVSSRSTVLRSFDDATAATVLAHARPGATYLTELRHLGGALGRTPEPENCVGHRDGVMNLFTSAYPADDLDRASQDQEELMTAVGPVSGGALATFLVGAQVSEADVRGAYRATDWDRLVSLKDFWDPTNRLRFNANIPSSRGFDTGPV